MRWLVAAVLLGSSASLQATGLCGSGEVTNEHLKMRILILNAPVDTHSPYVHVDAPNADQSYTLNVGYRPTEAGLGRPAMLRVTALVPHPAQGDAEPHQIEWRSASGRWFNPGYWSTPERSFPDKEARGAVGYTMAQGAPFPYRTELLDQLARGGRFDFRSLDRDGDVVSSGAVDYPPHEAVARMYDTARAQAAARLKPCGEPAPAIRPYAPPATKKAGGESAPPTE
ncbi:MAG TPA: hypothetical protein VF067_09135 [Sphingomicrobium sp.]